ncbi:hypothetical protein DMENIID0001_140300 [Sergentomyia squamirostris]
MKEKSFLYTCCINDKIFCEICGAEVPKKSQKTEVKTDIQDHLARSHGIAVPSANSKIKALANSFNKKKQQHAENEMVDVIYMEVDEDGNLQEEIPSAFSRDQPEIPSSSGYSNDRPEIPSSSGYSNEQLETPSTSRDSLERLTSRVSQRESSSSSESSPSPKKKKLDFENLVMKTFVKAHKNKEKMFNRGFKEMIQELKKKST